jgi:hypothetical protein
MQTLALEMGEVSVAMGSRVVWEWREVCRGFHSCIERLEVISKKPFLLTSWPGYFTTFSPPTGEYSSVRAILRSKPEAWYLQGKTKVLIIEPTQEIHSWGLLHCR